jgi:hypothetical protein
MIRSLRAEGLSFRQIADQAQRQRCADAQQSSVASQQCSCSRAEVKCSSYRWFIILPLLGLMPRLRQPYPAPSGRIVTFFIISGLSAHKTQKVASFLQAPPNVQLHPTPTYSSWLNQIEIWFSRIERDFIARGVFSSVRDLGRKPIRYIRACPKTARPFQWKYSSLRHHVYPCYEFTATCQ